jgi:hypothetical protein
MNRRRMTWCLVGLTVIAVLIAVSPRVVDELRPADGAAIWSYVVSRLTDEQIRAAQHVAEAQFQRNQQQENNDAVEATKRRAEECAKASDIAYKTRHPEACHWA